MTTVEQLQMFKQSFVAIVQWSGNEVKKVTNDIHELVVEVVRVMARAEAKYHTLVDR